MSFTFSFAWVLGGIALVLVGIALMRFYKLIADNFLSGIGSYDHVKLTALITIGVGMAATTNLIPFLLTLLANIVFRGGAA